MSHRWTLGAIVFFVTGVLCAAPHRPTSRPKKAGAAPTVTFESFAVVADGVTPGVKVHFASVTLGNFEDMVMVKKPAGTAIADAAGVARLTLPEPVIARAVWIIVDGGTGGYTVVAPPGMVLREVDFPDNGVHAGGGTGALRKVLVSRFAVDAFLIRPDVGIWTAYWRDGDAVDEDGGMNGGLSADVKALTPIAGGAAVPDRFAKGDVIFLVDRNTLEFFVTQRGN